MYGDGTAPWNKTKEKLLKPNQMTRTDDDGVDSRLNASSFIPRSVARVAVVQVKEPTDPLCVAADGPQTTTSEGAVAHLVESRDISLYSILGRPINGHVAGHAKQGTRLLSIGRTALNSPSPDPPLERLQALGALQPKSGGRSQPLSLCSLDAQRRHLPALCKAKQHAQPKEANRPPAPPAATTPLPPKSVTEKKDVGVYTMINRIVAGGTPPLTNCTPLKPLDLEKNPQSPEDSPHCYPGPLQHMRLVAPLSFRALKSAREPSATTVPINSTDSDHVNGGYVTRRGEGARYFDDVMFFFNRQSRPRGETTEPTTSVRDDEATKPPLVITQIKSGREKSNTLAQPRPPTLRALLASGDSVDLSPSQTCDSSEVVGYHRTDNTSLFDITACDYHETLTDYCNRTPWNHSVVKKSSLISLPSSKSDRGNRQASCLTSKALEDRGPESLQAGVCVSTQHSAFKVGDGVRFALDQQGDGMKNSVRSQAMKPAELRRADDLALSLWKYVARVEKKVEEAKRRVRAPRVRLRSTSSVQDPRKPGAVPPGQPQSAPSDGPTPMTCVSCDTAAESLHCEESDDADGNALLIPSMSELWDDLRSPNDSDDISLLSKTDTSSVHGGGADMENKGNMHSPAPVLSPPLDTRYLPGTTPNPKAPPPQATAVPPAGGLPPKKQQGPPHRPAKGDWGHRRCIDGKSNAHMYPGHLHHPGLRMQEQTHQQQVIKRQRQQLFHDHHHQRYSHSPNRGYQNYTLPLQPPCSWERRGQVEHANANPSSNTKKPKLQPVIRNGCTLYGGSWNTVEFAAMAGIGLSDARCVDSPNWQSLKLEDERVEQAKRGRRR